MICFCDKEVRSPFTIPGQSQVLSPGVWAPLCCPRIASHVRNLNLKWLKNVFFFFLAFPCSWCKFNLTSLEEKHRPVPVVLGITFLCRPPCSTLYMQSGCTLLCPGTLFLQCSASPLSPCDKGDLTTLLLDFAAGLLTC